VPLKKSALRPSVLRSLKCRIADVAAFILHFKDRSTEGRSADFFNGTYQTDATLWSVNFGYRF